ncbi:MmgE/PrpD family protein [Roseomonas terrae]|uniref:MmgE/PrpD family protein n=1 Tax=Neoroseomonas terrae TaxID=424799 RepID=A0ABS5EGE1_9PROT|nr:MmgE/PrpD family protein [Neoroseomonas terrae]
MTGTPTVSERLATFMLDTPGTAIPPDVLAQTKLQILDSIGLMLVVSGQEYGRSVCRAVQEMGRSDDATVIGTGERNTAMNAVLANGAMADALDYDDTHNETHLHPGAHIVPLTLAAGEARRSTGLEALTIAALGFEIGCRLAVAAPGQFGRRGFHTSAICGAVSTSLMASRFYGLSHQQAVWSVGTSASQAAGILQCYTDGTWTQGLHPGWIAHAAIAAALLGRAGFTGPPTAIEGRMGLFRTHVQDPDYNFDFDRTLRGLGTVWEGRTMSVKPYPTGCVIHPYLDAILALHRAGLRAEQVKRLRLPMSHHWVGIVCEPVAEKRRPATEIAGRISLQYAVAEALTRGRFGLDSVTEADLRDPAILDLVDRTDYELDPEPPARRAFKGWVIAELHDGRVLERIEHPWTRGNLDDPGTPALVRDKFRENAGRRLPSAQVEEIVAAVDAFETLADVGELARLCAIRG